MTAALFLLIASVIVGLATGLFFRVWALLLISPMIAILAAIVLQTADFGFWTGMPIIVAKNPLQSVATGSGQCLEEFDALKQVLISSASR